jgi:hypothetical protein
MMNVFLKLIKSGFKWLMMCSSNASTPKHLNVCYKKKAKAGFSYSEVHKKLPFILGGIKNFFKKKNRVIKLIFEDIYTYLIKK